LCECRAWKKEKEQREHDELERNRRDDVARVSMAVQAVFEDSKLSRREKIVKPRSIGLTLRKIGDLFDLTHERVRQILLTPREPRPVGRPRGPGKIRTPDPLGRLLLMWEATPPEARVEFLRRANEGRLP